MLLLERFFLYVVIWQLQFANLNSIRLKGFYYMLRCVLNVFEVVCKACLCIAQL